SPLSPISAGPSSRAPEPQRGWRGAPAPTTSPSSKRLLDRQNAIDRDVFEDLLAAGEPAHGELLEACGFPQAEVRFRWNRGLEPARGADLGALTAALPLGDDLCAQAEAVLA